MLGYTALLGTQDFTLQLLKKYGVKTIWSWWFLTVHFRGLLWNRFYQHCKFRYSLPPAPSVWKDKYNLRQKPPILQRTQTAGIHFSASGHLLTPFSSHSIMCWPCAVPGRCPSSDRLGKKLWQICMLLANDWKFCINLLANKQENNNSFPLSLGDLWGCLKVDISLCRVTFPWCWMLTVNTNTTCPVFV